MGMYTELSIAVNFKKDAPAEVIDAVRAMESGDESYRPPPSIAEHKLFRTERWSWMLRSAGSWYFDGPVYSKFVKDQNTWKLGVHTNIKNYSGEWKAFVDFIAPYLDVDETGPRFLGHYRYEEDLAPTLLYLMPDGTVSWERGARPTDHVPAYPGPSDHCGYCGTMCIKGEACPARPTGGPRDE